MGQSLQLEKDKGATLMSILQTISLMQVNYDLVVLEDERVPLAPSGSDYFWPTVVVMVLLALAVLLAVYLIRCNGFRKRIRELDSEGINYLGWSLSRLKETVAELEAKKVEENFEES